MALQPRDVSEIQRRVKEGNITREFVDEIKSRAGRLSVRQLAGLPEQDVKASKVQSIKASDPFVTTGNTGIDTVLDADVRGKRGVSDAKRLKAKESSLPEDVRIKRQFEQLYRKQKAEDRTKILQGFAKDAMDAAPEGGVSPYQAMEAELSNIMRSRLNLPEEEEQDAPSFMSSFNNNVAAFFAKLNKKTSAGETLVDTISGERVKPLSEMTDEELEAIQ